MKKYVEIFEAVKLLQLKNIIYIVHYSFDLNAYSVNTDSRKNSKLLYREAREMLARNKNVLNCIIKPKPTFFKRIYSC